MKYLDFYAELMALMGSEPVCFSKQLYLDMHYLKERILSGRTEDVFCGVTYDSLCHCVLRITKVLKKRMPDSIHARLVLDQSNKAARDYIKYCERHGI